MMKFSGLHLHMVLVLAVICVVVYVFYVSRDIVTLDKEVKMLHSKVEQLAARAMQQRPLPPPQQHAAMQPPIQAKPMPRPAASPSMAPPVVPASQGVPPSAMPSPPLAAVAEEDDISESGSYTETETSSETTEKIKEILNEVDSASSTKDIEVLSTTEAVVTPDYSKLSWNEIKEKCRERGIPIKGFNKEQLLAKLNT